MQGDQGILELFETGLRDVEVEAERLTGCEISGKDLKRVALEINTWDTTYVSTADPCMDIQNGRRVVATTRPNRE